MEIKETGLVAELCTDWRQDFVNMDINLKIP
jgi:hypothetical protein